VTYRQVVRGLRRARPTAAALAVTRAEWIRHAYLEYHAGRLSGPALRDLLRRTRGA
jgi:hypothetical protein